MSTRSRTRELRRYTGLPFLIDFLRTRELVLPSPVTWDDRNDSYYLEQYAKQAGLSATFALCLTEAPETYHHWRVFSSGASGVCISFKTEPFMAAVGGVSGLRAESVEYRTIDDLRRRKPTLSELPFLKRHPYRDEKEFRLFMAPKAAPPAGVVRIPMPLKTVDRVTLSPWLPASVAKQTTALLKSMPGCGRLKIYRSTLVDNQTWKKYGDSPA